MLGTVGLLCTTIFYWHIFQLVFFLLSCFYFAYPAWLLYYFFFIACRAGFSFTFLLFIPSHLLTFFLVLFLFQYFPPITFDHIRRRFAYHITLEYNSTTRKLLPPALYSILLWCSFLISDEKWTYIPLVHWYIHAFLS